MLHGNLHSQFKQTQARLIVGSRVVIKYKVWNQSKYGCGCITDEWVIGSHIDDQLKN